MKNIWVFLIFLVFSVSCQQNNKEKSEIFVWDKYDIQIGEGNKNYPITGWYFPEGSLKKDTAGIARWGEGPVLTLFPSDSNKVADLYFVRPVNSKVDGKQILFKGNYKSSPGVDSLQIVIRQVSFTEGVKEKDIYLPLKNDWNKFSVHTEVIPGVFQFYLQIRMLGDTEVQLSDLQAYIDDKPLEKNIHKRYKADAESQYEGGTDISLGELTPFMVENLEILGKVWGFLKYYHPKVANGLYDWDAELFYILPQVAKATDKTERNKLLNKWIDSYGKIRKTADYAIADSTKYSRIINLNWINDKNLFDVKLIEKLNRIRSAKRDKDFNYYVIPYRSQMVMDWDHEKKYANMKWNDQGFRLLSLFRVWNIIEYCFPYRDLTDRPWEELLKEYIPLFFSSQHEKDYQLALLRLFAEVGDGHAQTSIDSGELLAETDGDRYSWFAINFLETKEGEIAVQRSFFPELQPGDVLLAINGKTPQKIIEELYPYIPGSNQPVKNFFIINHHLFHLKSSTQMVTILRDNKKLDINLGRPTLEEWSLDLFYPTKNNWEKYDLEKKEISYLDISRMDEESIKSILAKSQEAKGIIIDLRKYPGFQTTAILHAFLMSSQQTVGWYSKNENQFPGNYSLELIRQAGEDNPDYFKGKVAILVNEETMSQGEECAMGYQKSPQSKVIGSTTAGADGNTSIFPLPGNIDATFTARGVYYPDWEICQRTGIKIDIPVRPTAEDLRAEKDVWIEAAIQYILEEE